MIVNFKLPEKIIEYTLKGKAPDFKYNDISLSNGTIKKNGEVVSVAMKTPKDYPFDHINGHVMLRKRGTEISSYTFLPEIAVPEIDPVNHDLNTKFFSDMITATMKASAPPISAFRVALGIRRMEASYRALFLLPKSKITEHELAGITRLAIFSDKENDKDSINWVRGEYKELFGGDIDV